MHLLRRRGLIEREITTISSVDSDPSPRQRGRRRLAAMELRLCELRRGAHGGNRPADAIEHRDQRRLGRISELVANKRLA